MPGTSKRSTRALLESPDPPLLLYVQGDAARLAAPSIAVVGSRHPTPQGADNARAFAQALSAQGHMIVRHIARWPGRSAITALGVALSMGLLFRNKSSINVDELNTLKG